MISSRLLQIGIAGSACAVMLFASDFWKTKDSSQWNSEEINKILSDSPWAKAKTVQPQRSQMRQRGMGRRGGFGFPGGGIGYPGGGGGGVGYPGGGGGGGYPNGGGGNSGAGQTEPRNEPMNLTIRWESAAPVEAALMREGDSASDELKAVVSSTGMYYVIEVLGLRMPRRGGRNRGGADEDSDNNGQSQDRDQDRSQDRSNDALRSQLLDAAQLAPKGKSSIYAKDVQIAGPGGIDGVRFLFPRTTPISAGDKEVDFILDIRRIKIEEKFKLSDMQYEGKLAI
ncbi:MAG TPA: hypothetical protein VFW44_06260 [Bryobacteraceae bacterium]|nr:hypothetical protein [Bryobacteraceae bacterium]